MKRLLIALPFALALILATPALAYLETPTGISIISAQAVKNVIQDGDMCIVFHYNIAYSSYPTTTPASDSIIFNLYSPDGTTLLLSAKPHVFFNYGYGQGVGSFYFSTAPTWNLAYKINIVGSPAFYDPPPTYFYTMTTADYSTMDTPADNQQVMANYILSVCDRLEAVYPTVTLHGSTDAGIALTAIGEMYFRRAVPGLQSIAPSLFYIQFYVPTPVQLTYSANMTSVYGARLAGSDIMSGFTEMGKPAGVSGEFVAATICFLIAIAAIVFTAAKGWGVEPGLIMGAIVMTLGALLLGETIMVLRMIMGLLAGMMIFFLLFFKRA